MKKNPDQNLEKRRPTFLMIGMMASLALTLVAFEWTDYSKSQRHSVRLDDEAIDIEIITPHKIEKPAEPKSASKPPAKSPFVKIGDPDPVADPYKVTFDLKEDFDGLSYGDDEDFGLGGVEEVIPFKPYQLQHPPHYLECEDPLNREEQKMCTELKVIRMVQEKAIFPRDCMGLSQTVYVSFVVDQKGEITKVKALREGHPLFDKAAVRAVEQLPDMVPGKQFGRTVPVQYEIPVTFKSM